MPLFSSSPLARLLGMVDMSVLVVVVTSMLAAHILFLDAPWVSWLGWFYIVLWVNKAVFTAGFGGAFPAVFGLSETGVISLNPTWYIFSTAILCILVTTAVVESYHGIMFAVVASIACGRATIPPLIMARMLAVSYDRENYTQN